MWQLNLKSFCALFSVEGHFYLTEPRDPFSQNPSMAANMYKLCCCVEYVLSTYLVVKKVYSCHCKNIGVIEPEKKCFSSCVSLSHYMLFYKTWYIFTQLQLGGDDEQLMPTCTHFWFTQEVTRQSNVVSLLKRSPNYIMKSVIVTIITGVSNQKLTISKKTKTQKHFVLLKHCTAQI